MKKIFFGALLAASFSFAGEISQLTQVQCENESGSFLQMSTLDNSIQAKLPELPELSNQSLENKEPLTKINWSPGRLYGFGGLATSSDERFLGLVTLLYTADQESNLPEQDEFRIHYADQNGITSEDFMNCELTFTK